MALQKVLVNGQAFIVDAPSKAIAKAFGKTQVKVEVVSVETMDLIGLDLESIPKLEAKAKAAPAEGEAGQTPAAE